MEIKMGGAAMQTDHEIKAPADSADGPDQGHNQWVEFCVDYKNFPYDQGVALGSMEDIHLECGKLYITNKDIELRESDLPRPLYSVHSSAGVLGACGRYCAAVGTQGTIILHEQGQLGFPDTLGRPVLTVTWQCLWRSYAYNSITVNSIDGHYEVTSVTPVPTDGPLGRIVITLTYIP